MQCVQVPVALGTVGQLSNRERKPLSTLAMACTSEMSSCREWAGYLLPTFPLSGGGRLPVEVLRLVVELVRLGRTEEAPVLRAGHGVLA